MENTDIVKLSNELMYQKYLMNREHVREQFEKVSISEYIALHSIASAGEYSDIYMGRSYLEDLAA